MRNVLIFYSDQLLKSSFLTLFELRLGSTFSFSYRCPFSDSLATFAAFSFSKFSGSRLLPLEVFGTTTSGSRRSGGRLLFGLRTAIEGIVYCGTFDMFSCGLLEEFDRLSSENGQLFL